MLCSQRRNSGAHGAENSIQISALAGVGHWHLAAADVATRLPRTPPFSRLLRYAGGYSRTILTPNLQRNKQTCPPLFSLYPLPPLFLLLLIHCFLFVLLYYSVLLILCPSLYPQQPISLHSYLHSDPYSSSALPCQFPSNTCFLGREINRFVLHFFHFIHCTSTPDPINLY